jgi:hypothetical protein
MPAPPSRPAPPPDPRLDAAPPELAEGDRRALLEARTRFWREGPQAALEDYSELAGRLADHPDVIGELGNLHMLLRQPEAAAEQYARAAELLQAAGRPAQARDTARLVGRLDPQRARELLETLSGDDGA